MIQSGRLHIDTHSYWRERLLDGGREGWRLEGGRRVGGKDGGRKGERDIMEM